MSGIVEFNWVFKKNTYCAGLIASIDCAIEQAKTEYCSGKQGLAQQRVTCLGLLKIQANMLKQQEQPNTFIKAANNLGSSFSRDKVILWAGTTLLDGICYWINKLASLFSPKRAACLFRDHYAVMVHVDSQIKAACCIIKP